MMTGTRRPCRGIAMTSDRAPRTPDQPEREGMEGIAIRWERMGSSRGSGGSSARSMCYHPSGGDGEDGGDICNPPRACVPFRGLGAFDVLSCVGSDLSPPSPPSSPVSLQAFDIAWPHPLQPLQSILSLFQSILSIPSLRNQWEQGKVGGNWKTAKSCERAMP